MSGPHQSKVNNRAPRQINRSVVLDLVRQSEPLSRTEIARRTGLTKPTVSAIVEELMRDNAVREIGTEASGGRPARMIQYNEERVAYLGIELGVRQTVVGVADARGRLRAEVAEPAIVGDFKKTLELLASLVPRALSAAEVPRSRIAGICAAVPGLVDQITGECVLAPNLGWRNLPLRTALGALFEEPVSLYNVTQAAATAEGRIGVAVGCESYIWIYAGHGVGAGIVIGGRPFFGKEGYSGEIGHCRVEDKGPLCGCGRRGCLETFASISALERALVTANRRAGKKLPQRKTLASLVAAANDGDRVARTIFADAGTRLASGVGFLINILSPQLVVIGGELMVAEDWVLGPMRRALPEHAVHAAGVPIALSSLGERAALQGTLLLAMDNASRSYRLAAFPR
jgi:predicted NBD/HSP70 family sugar kinase